MSIIPTYNEQVKSIILRHFGDHEKAAEYFHLSPKTFKRYINDIPSASAPFKIKVELFLQNIDTCLILSENEFIKLVAYRCLESIETKFSFFNDGLRSLIETCKMENCIDLQNCFELCLYISIYKVSGDPKHFQKSLKVIEKVRHLPITPINIATITNGLIFGYKHFPYFIDLSNSDLIVEQYIHTYIRKFSNLKQSNCPSDLLHSYEKLHSEWIHLSEKLYNTRLYDYYTYLGAAYFRFQSYDKALVNFQLASKYRLLESDKVEVFTNLSISHFMLEDRSTAFEYLNLALKNIDESDPRINNIYLNAWEMIRVEGQTDFAKTYMDQVNFADYLSLEGGTAHLTESLFEEFERTCNGENIRQFFLVVIEQYANDQLDFRRIEWIINYIHDFFSKNHDKELLEAFFNVTNSICKDLHGNSNLYISKDIFDQISCMFEGLI